MEWQQYGPAFAKTKKHHRIKVVKHHCQQPANTMQRKTNVLVFRYMEHCLQHSIEKDIIPQHLASKPKP